MSTNGTRDVVVPGQACRIFLRVVSVDAERTWARVVDKAGYEFQVPCVLPEFLGSNIALESGMNISAVMVGQYDGLTDAMVEDNLREREKFESVPNDVRGWTPGIATNFNKQ